MNRPGTLVRWVTLCGFLLTVAVLPGRTLRSQQTMPVPTVPPPPPTVPPPTNGRGRIVTMTPSPIPSMEPPPDGPGPEVERNQERRRNADRQKQLVLDTQRLVALAGELKAVVDKSNKDTMSLDVIRKAEEIEKLARSVKEKMKGN